MRRSARLGAAAVFIGFVLMLGLSRVPFLSNTLLGEEGMFAALVLSPTPPSAEVPNGLPQQLIAQIDGRRFYGVFEHPIVPYLVMERGIGVLGRAAHALEGDFTYRNQVARGCFFALFAVGVLGLLWLAAIALVDTRASAPTFVIPAFVLYVLTTPLLLGASIQPQVDGSVGVMLMGLAAFAMAAGQGRALDKPAFWLAGILIGLGRIEWVIAFAVAALAVVIAQVALAERAQRLQPLLFLAGLAVGSALSYLASPADYLDGINVMSRISATSNGSFEAARQQRPLLTPALLTAAAALAFSAVRPRAVLGRASGTLILMLGGLGVILGFAASNWSGDGFPRYYAPALVALAVAVIDLAGRASWTSPGRIAAVLLILAGLWPNLQFARDRLARDVSITSLPGTSLAAMRAQMATSAAWASAEHAIPLENSSIWLYYPSISFVSKDLGLAGAKELLAENNPADLARLRVP
ncbi:MAG: hypothetical protein P4M07_05680 [Xanthobacteraceae bacterium]|nr:hypothetical protein [Xanthobacteraceae bacterium]